MIRKLLLAEAQTALGKQKMRRRTTFNMAVRILLPFAILTRSQ